MYEIFERLCEKQGITTYRFCKDTGVNPSTISTWKNRNTSCNLKLAKIIAEYFNVSVDYIMTGSDKKEKKETALTSKDERDIERILDQTREHLLSQEGLMFDGKPASQEAIDSILSAMQVGMELAKKKNKEKYTPKKYKKD